MSAEQEVQASNCLSSDRNEMCHLYLHLWPLDVEQRVCGSQVGEEVNPVSPAEPQLSCRAPVFCKHKQAFLVQKTAIPRLLKTCHRTIHTPYHNSSVLDSSRPAQWPVGASRPRLQTQMGVQARDDFHMSLCTCKCVLSLLFFFLSLISFFVFLLKMPHWDWEAVL